MWIKKVQYERLRERIDALEKKTEELQRDLALTWYTGGSYFGKSHESWWCGGHHPFSDGRRVSLAQAVVTLLNDGKYKYELPNFDGAIVKVK